MITMIVLTGCVESTLNAQNNQYCQLSLELDLSNPRVRKTYFNADPITERYIRVEQSTHTCACKSSQKEIDDCFNNIMRK